MLRLLITVVVFSAFATSAWAGGPARSFSHTVSAEASRVEPPSGDKSYDSIRCWHSGASAVYVGGKDVSPRNGFPICTLTPVAAGTAMAEGGAKCASDTIKLRTSDLYAVATSGQQFLICIATQGD